MFESALFAARFEGGAPGVVAEADALENSNDNGLQETADDETDGENDDRRENHRQEREDLADDL